MRGPEEEEKKLNKNIVFKGPDVKEATMNTRACEIMNLWR